MNRKLAAFCVTALSAAACFSARAEGKKTIDLSKLPPPADKQNVTYASEIKQILDHSCVKCHSGPKAKGKLHLDTLDGALKGGEDGKEILPGNSAGSALVINIAHLGDEDDYMPPPGNKAGIDSLTKEQIGLIRAWIDQGAK
jgi:mono/diheme cytochrome c family protein